MGKIRSITQEDMAVNTNLIKFILEEHEKWEEGAKQYATHTPDSAKFIGKLLYYKASVWENRKKSDLFLAPDLVGVERKTHEKDDGVIPFFVVYAVGKDLQDEYAPGDVLAVDRGRVTGDVLNPDFAALADLFLKEKSKDGKTLVEKQHAPEQKLASLIRFWEGYKVQAPWLQGRSFEESLVYHLPFPEQKGKINLKELKELCTTL